MSKRRLLRYINYVLWALPVIFLLTIGILNALPTIESIPHVWDLVLSYGLLFSLCGAMTVQTLRHRKAGSSESAFYLKLMALGFFFLTLIASLLKDVFA